MELPMTATQPRTALTRTPRTTAKRRPQRASYDRALADAILDEALVSHVGFAVGGQPYVIPTIHARRGDVLYIHGSAASHMLRTLAGGVPVCVTR
jgi:nitroimidazol reductase NimA-like FMN-containing flavoprotein (pyridoxamine 5'-phosphate oxidase superfamily)